MGGQFGSLYGRRSQSQPELSVLKLQSIAFFVSLVNSDEQKVSFTVPTLSSTSGYAPTKQTGFSYIPLLPVSGRDGVPQMYQSKLNDHHPRCFAMSGHRLFVRDLFLPMAKEILIAQSHSGNTVLIGGTSGVGKSVYLFWLIRHFAKMGWHLIYDSLADDFCVFIRGRGVDPNGNFTIMWDDVTLCKTANEVIEKEEKLNRDNCIILVDIGNESLRPQPTSQRRMVIPPLMVVVSSPGKQQQETVKNLMKNTTFKAVFYVDVWSRTEILGARRILFPIPFPSISGNLGAHVPVPIKEGFYFSLQGNDWIYSIDEKEVSRRFDIVGGIPRLCFTEDAPDEFDSIVKTNVESAVALQDAVLLTKSSAGSHMVIPKGLSSIVHLRSKCSSADWGPGKVWVEFASSQMLRKTFDHLRSASINAMYRFVESAGTSSFWSAACGDAFELIGHDELSRGGLFKSRQLDVQLGVKRGKKRVIHPDVTVDFPIPTSSKKKLLVSPDGIPTLGSNEYGQPDHKTYRTLDAIKKPNMMFQITVSHTHDRHVNIDGLIENIEPLLAFANSKNVPLLFIFVVMPSKFPIFTPGNFVKAAGSTKTIKSLKDVLGNVKLEFWVVELPLQPGAAQIAATAAKKPKQ